MEFSATWTNLEVLQDSGCPQLSSPGGALPVYRSLTSLHLGCSLLHPDPPELEDLGKLRVFRVVHDGCGSWAHRGGGASVVPHSPCRQPSLAFI